MRKGLRIKVRSHESLKLVSKGREGTEGGKEISIQGTLRVKEGRILSGSQGLCFMLRFKV